jgi:hypothetical protein
VCLEVTVGPRGEESQFYLLPEGALEVRPRGMIVSQEVPPTILTNSSSPTVLVSPGGRALLYCTVLGAARRTVSWVRVDGSSPTLLTVGQFIFSKDPRIAVTVAPSLSRWSLTITVRPLPTP